MAWWLWYHYHLIDIIYILIGALGNATFLVFNGNIFYRVLRSDGYLGAGRQHLMSFDRGVAQTVKKSFSYHTQISDFQKSSNTEQSKKDQ